MEDVVALSRWAVKTPSFPATYGQGPAPTAVVVVVDGRRYDFVFGLEVQASNYCDPAGKVANLDAEPPLVRTGFIAQNPTLFEHLSDPE